MADIVALKAELGRLGTATELGFEAGGEAIERIKMLAEALEAANPTPVTTRADALLHGRWRLLYSSFGLQRDTTLARLAFNQLPKTAIHVDALWQEVDPATGLYDNVIDFSSADGPGINVTLGKYTADADQRLGVEFFASLVAPTTGSSVGRHQIELDTRKFPALYSDVTYLDADFRLNRGSFGNLYVLQLVDRTPTGWSRDL
nr:PAP/fibrillin family protein [Polymorphobacter sp.]